MYTADLSKSVALLFAELTEGANAPHGNFMLNAGDAGLLRSLDALSADEASHAVAGGATVAAHAQHLRFGLSLMNQWAREGGNPFANAKWDEAWKTTVVTDREWQDIRSGLRSEVNQWKSILSTPREVAGVELSGMISSVAHLAYHLGAIRQIAAATRGPREGTFN